MNIKEETNILVKSYGEDEVEIKKDNIRYLYNFATEETTILPTKKDYNNDRIPFNRVFANFEQLLKYREAKTEFNEGKRDSISLNDYCLK